jgi:NAD(P)-dependent dehydrogenase (short-subunit alcohol dehydrogenase family)
VLVNAAATDAPGPAEDVPVADWQRVIAVNLTVPFLLSRAVFPHMRAAGGGTIVNVSSVAGHRGWVNPSPGIAPPNSALPGSPRPSPPRVRPMASASYLFIPARWPPTGARGARRIGQPRRAAPDDALPPEDAAGYISWLVCAPAHLIVTEAVVAPIRERGWP